MLDLEASVYRKVLFVKHELKGRVSSMTIPDYLVHSPISGFDGF